MNEWEEPAVEAVMSWLVSVACIELYTRTHYGLLCRVDQNKTMSGYYPHPLKCKTFMANPELYGRSKTTTLRSE